MDVNSCLFCYYCAVCYCDDIVALVPIRNVMSQVIFEEREKKKTVKKSNKIVLEFIDIKGLKYNV